MMKNHLIYTPYGIVLVNQKTILTDLGFNKLSRSYTIMEIKAN